MAKTTVTHVTDDLDGSKDAQEVTFSFNGVDYKIDLGKKNLAAFEKAMKPFLDGATKVTKRSGGNRRRASGGGAGAGRDLGAIREWAKSAGVEVAERGRVSKSVIEQYDAANG